MSPPHVEAVPTPVPQPDRTAGDWFHQRLDFQIELARRMMHVEKLTDDTMLEWTKTYAAQFARIVDAKDEEGEAVRRLIREDRETAFVRVQQLMLH